MTRIVPTVFIFVIVSLDLIVAENCPNSTLLQPCSCEAVNGRLSLYCNDGRVDEINGLFDTLSPMNLTFQLVDIRNKDLIYLRKHFFQNTVVSRVNFNLPSLKSVHINVFDDQDNNNLEIVRFDNTSLSSIPSRVLKSLEKITRFDFTNSKVVEIVEEDGFKGFAGVENIVEICYSKNSITSVKRGAFAQLVNLQKLDLSHNKLKEINRNVFPPSMKKFTQISLMDNELTELPGFLADELSANGVINLEKNKIETLDASDLRRVIRNHLELSLENNDMVCECSHMVIATANKNGLKSVFKGSCKSLAINKIIAFPSLTYKQLPGCFVSTDTINAIMLRKFPVY